MLNHALSTFLAIHRTGGISAASAELHLSQPAVSRRLQTLERQLGVALFERTRGGLRLTSAGEVLLPHAERAYAAELDARHAVDDHLRRASGAVRVGIVGSVAGAWFTTVLERARAAHPDIDLAVSTATSRQVRDQVLVGDITIGVGYLTPLDPDLDITTLFHERLVIACGTTHPLAGQRIPAIDALRDERWLLFPEQHTHPESANNIARQWLLSHQISHDRIQPVDSLTAQRALVEAGYGLAMLPVNMIADDLARATLATIDAADTRIDTPVIMTTRTHAYLSPAATTVIDLLTSIAYHLDVTR